MPSLIAIIINNASQESKNKFRVSFNFYGILKHYFFKKNHGFSSDHCIV